MRERRERGERDRSYFPSRALKHICSSNLICPATFSTSLFGLTYHRLAWPLATQSVVGPSTFSLNNRLLGTHSAITHCCSSLQLQFHPRSHPWPSAHHSYLRPCFSTSEDTPSLLWQINCDDIIAVMNDGGGSQPMCNCVPFRTASTRTMSSAKQTLDGLMRVKGWHICGYHVDKCKIMCITLQKASP